jgi:hypothetical protein
LVLGLGTAYETGFSTKDEKAIRRSGYQQKPLADKLVSTEF